MNVNEESGARVVVDAQNPWPGLDYFAEQSQAFFHGRDAEADLLLSMVRHRLLTVLYGQSGLGKSSLLQAGLFPRLRADGWLPVYIRLSHTDADGLGGKGPTALIAQTRQFIREAIAQAIAEGQLLGEGSANGHTAAGAPPSPMPRDDESLWEYLHRRDSGLRSATRERVAPVLVFDQFEEIFTLGRSEARRAIRQTFLRDLADCVENRLPEYVLKEMNRRERGEGDPFAALDFPRQDYRVVLSLREDYLAELHDLSELMPSIHENETRLVPLNGWQALDAVAIPGETLIEPVVAREIVELVAARRRGGDGKEEDGASVGDDGEMIDEARLEVDPALLSMVCRELNIERQRRQLPKITQEITNDLLHGSSQSVLRRFYRECFQALPERETAAEVQKFVEDELLTPTGYRNMAELVRTHHRLSRAGVREPAAAIQELIDQRLLRVNERPQDKTRWLELTHDVLCDVVKESRQERELREANERAEREKGELAAQRLAEAERQRIEAEAQAQEAKEREAEALTHLRHMRRARRFGITALVLMICFAATLCLLGLLAAGRFRTGVEAQKRSRGMLEQAQERLTRAGDDRRHVIALRQLGRALRADPTNADVVKLASQLLITKNWSPPLSQPLHYPDSPLFSVGMSPNNREIVAVAQDGNLVRWNVEDFKRLPSVSLVPDKPKAPAVLTSAAFSRDGKRILITLFPPGRENARVCVWSEQDQAYQPNVADLEFRESIRSIAWSGDGNSLFVFAMRFDQSNCRVFQSDGTRFSEKNPIANAFTGDLSPDDRWFATAAPGGRVQIWDARTLQPAPAGGEVQPLLEPTEANPEARIYSLVFSDDGQELAGTTMRDPAYIWDVHSGTARMLRPKSPRDRLMKVMFAPLGRGGQSIATITTGATGAMIGMLDAVEGELRTEPMCLPDAFVVPAFRSDGKMLITLSGGFWQAMDTVRAWDLALRKSPTGASALQFTGKSAPAWLPELTDAVAGIRQVADDNESAPALLSELRTKYAGSVFPKEYQPLWDRFLASRAP